MSRLPLATELCNSAGTSEVAGQEVPGRTHTTSDAAISRVSVVAETTYHYKLERVTAEGKRTFLGPIPAITHATVSQANPGEESVPVPKGSAP